MVPTTISDSAVAILNQIDIRVATSASPSQSAAIAHTWVILHRLRTRSGYARSGVCQDRAVTDGPRGEDTLPPRLTQ